MGGDGGVVATNRRYMRGAGSADHTADSSRASALDVAEAEKERLQQGMRMCAITGQSFDFTPPDDRVDGDTNSGSKARAQNFQSTGIVVCPYGRLYSREAAVQALLRRLEQHRSHTTQGGGECVTEPEIGWHVRGLKDLNPVRFYVVDQSSDGAGAAERYKSGIKRIFLPACPIAGIDLNGLHPTYVIVRKKKKTKKGGKERGLKEPEEPNVLCEKALKEMGIESLQEEYGPFLKEDLIRLAPPSGKIFDDIRNELTLRRNRDTTRKEREDKFSDGGNNGEGRQKRIAALSEVPQIKKPRTSMSSSASRGLSTVDVMRKNVAAAVASSAALSSLFENKRSHLSEKEKKNNLFVR